jgi:SAM-dependent methyltransferase
MSASNLLARKPFQAFPDSRPRAVSLAFGDWSRQFESDNALPPAWFEAGSGQGQTKYEGIVSHYETRLNAANGSVFHFGAGCGEMMESLRQHGFSVMGCEPSEQRVELARLSYGFDRHTLHCCNSETFLHWIRRIGQKAQAIFFRHGFEHSLELHALLRRMADVLRENGLLIALLPPPYSNHSREVHLSFVNELAIGCTSCNGGFEVVEIDCNFQNRFMAFVLQKTPASPHNFARNDTAHFPQPIAAP